MKTLCILLFFPAAFATEPKKTETPFFNEHFADSLSQEFQKFRGKMQELEARVTGTAKKTVQKGSEAVQGQSQKAKESGKRALLRLADELEDTAKKLRQKADE